MNMPGRVIALYVILCLRVLTNGVGLVKLFPPSSLAAEIICTVATIDFSACFFMLIALYQRKRWLILLFRIYVAVAMPISLLLMGASSLAKERSGEAMAWNPFVGGVLAAIGFAVFAWCLGGARVREYLKAETVSGEPPVIGDAIEANQHLRTTDQGKSGDSESSDQTLSPGTPRAGHDPRLP